MSRKRVRSSADMISFLQAHSFSSLRDRADQNMVSGVFVDERARLLLVHSTEERVSVLTSEDEEVHFAWHDGTLEGGQGLRGTCDGEDVIRWASGKKWQRLHLSQHQWRLLIRPPYVPMSLVLLGLLKSLVTRTTDALLTWARKR